MQYSKKLVTIADAQRKRSVYKLKVGIIGCGRVANTHLRIYRSINRIKPVEVVAVSSKNLDTARSFAARHRIARFSSDLTTFLQNKDLDLVDICTPTSTHSHIACATAEFGHDIFLEKPMALSTAECDKMINASKQHGVRLCVCHNQLFFPAVRHAKSLVDSRNYNVLSFKTIHKESPEGPLTFSPAWVFTPQEKGFLWEFGYHLAYLQLHFLEKITEVYAIGNKVKYPVLDNFSAILATNSKPYGIMELSMIAKEPEIVYEIDNSDGKSLVIDRISLTSTEKPTIQKRSPSSKLGSVLNYFVPIQKAPRNEWGFFIGHFNLINEYIKCLANDKPPPVKPEQAKEAIKLLECVEKSIDLHKVVRLNDH